MRRSGRRVWRTRSSRADQPGSDRSGRVFDYRLALDDLKRNLLVLVGSRGMASAVDQQPAGRFAHFLERLAHRGQTWPNSSGDSIVIEAGQRDVIRDGDTGRMGRIDYADGPYTASSINRTTYPWSHCTGDTSEPKRR